jgi:hypothetical protein
MLIYKVGINVTDYISHVELTAGTNVLLTIWDSH